MVESWVLWLFVVGVAIGVVAALVVAIRLPRQEDDVSDLERPAEAAWISSIIERHGGIAPASLVEEVLDLHQAYLRDPRLARPPIEVAGGVVPETPAYVTGYGLGYGPGQVPGYVPGYGPGQVPGSSTGQVPGQLPGYPTGQVPGQAGVEMPGHAPANGLSAPLVGPPRGTPAGEVLDRRAQ